MAWISEERAIRTMSKLRQAGNYVAFRCPGCGGIAHRIPIADVGKPFWNWNNDVEKPTLRPSIVIERDLPLGGVSICHSHVTDGKIAYQADSTHSLSGKEVELPDWES